MMQDNVDLAAFSDIDYNVSEASVSVSPSSIEKELIKADPESTQ